MLFSNNRKLVIKTNGGRYFYLVKLSNFIIIVSVLLLIGMYLIKFKTLFINTDDFKTFFSMGIQGHLVNLITVLFLYVFSSRKHKFMHLMALVWVIFLALASAKYIMIIYSFSLLMVSYFKKKFKFKHLMLMLLIIASLFVVTYILRSIFNGEEVDLSFIFRHFNYYLTGSFYSFSKVLTTNVGQTQNVGIGIILAPLINVMKLLAGDSNYISSISKFIEVDINSSYKSTNVFTLFGSIIMETNIAVAIVFVIFLSIISYILLYLLKRRNSSFTIILYSFVMATLFCSFFNCFYGTLNLFEIVVIIVGIEFVNYLYNRIFMPKRKCRFVQKISTEKEKQYV